MYAIVTPQRGNHSIVGFKYCEPVPSFNAFKIQYANLQPPFNAFKIQSNPICQPVTPF